ncbi:hypothetical protein FRC18_001425 [Serendipita sp. 400]|nr:hypothetical protein FRC18_001425 [Serendipita sp. 400]
MRTTASISQNHEFSIWQSSPSHGIMRGSLLVSLYLFLNSYQHDRQRTFVLWLRTLSGVDNRLDRLYSCREFQYHLISHPLYLSERYSCQKPLPSTPAASRDRLSETARVATGGTN